MKATFAKLWGHTLELTQLCLNYSARICHLLGFSNNQIQNNRFPIYRGFHKESWIWIFFSFIQFFCEDCYCHLHFYDCVSLSVHVEETPDDVGTRNQRQVHLLRDKGNSRTLANELWRVNKKGLGAFALTVCLQNICSLQNPPRSLPSSRK